MGIFERMGVLVLIVLAVVMIVITGWGFGAPRSELYPEPGTPLAVASGGPADGGLNVNPVQPEPPAPSPWPERTPVRPPAPPAPVDPPADPPQVTPPPTPPAPPVPATRDVDHVVAKKDTLFGIAAKYYGDGKLWPVIAQANPGVDPKDLTVGVALRIPDPDKVLSPDAPDAPPLPDRIAPAPTPAGSEYVVEEGDSLWRIAEKTLGQGSQYKKILDANRDLLRGDENNVHAGMKLKIPR